MGLVIFFYLKLNTFIIELPCVKDNNIDKEEGSGRKNRFFYKD